MILRIDQFHKAFTDFAIRSSPVFPGCQEIPLQNVTECTGPDMVVRIYPMLEIILILQSYDQYFTIQISRICYKACFSYLYKN